MANSIPVQDAVAAAAASLEALQKRHTALTDRGEVIREIREQIAFDALSGDQAAALRVDEINGESFLLAEQLATVEAAIREARRRLTAARQAADAAVGRVQAEKALVHIGRFEGLAAEMDNICRRLVETGEAMKVELRAVHALGCSHPSERLYIVNAVRAIKAGLMGSVLQLEHIAPLERHTVASLAAGWGAAVRRWAAERGAVEAEAAP